MVTLKVPLTSVGFVEREKENGNTLSNKCGRDFLYYCLNFYFPETFNASKNNPREIDRERLFGIPVPAWLAWTQVQFSTLPRFLKTQGLELSINHKKITSYVSFIYATLFSRVSYEDALQTVERAVSENVACAIDIPIGTGGLMLLDHVMFVYGYDEENLYVFDTLQVARLEYERMDETVHYYKLPKKVIKKRWSRFGRVWEVKHRMYTLGI
jgi:hypothetical protein